MDEKTLAAAFNKWMDLYISDPDGFRREWETVQGHLAARSAGQEPSYGASCAAYLLSLIQA